MAKILTILLIALIFEAVGVVLLSKGLKQIGEAERIAVSEVASLMGRGLTNSNILLGVLCEAIFFAGLLVLMSKSDVSVIWPLTALGFVLTTLAAKFILHEDVSMIRWVGVILIMAGAALITWSEKGNEPSAGTKAPAGSAARQGL
ncbi:MAG: EamA family transporter [Chloroflexi bacterium]|nr:EamA family transporter [Chloroflexota bacterium]